MKTQKVEWKTGAGQQVEITITRGPVKEVAYCDGHNVSIVKVRTVLVATLDGETLDGHLDTTGHPMIVAKIGKLGMVKANYDRIMTAINDLEKADNEAARKADQEYQDHSDVMRKAMSY